MADGFAGLPQRSCPSLLFPLHGDPQRVTQPCEQPEDGIRGRSVEILFHRFPRRAAPLERRLQQRVGPTQGECLGSRVPYRSMKAASDSSCCRAPFDAPRARRRRGWRFPARRVPSALLEQFLPRKHDSALPAARPSPLDSLSAVFHSIFIPSPEP